MNIEIISKKEDLQGLKNCWNGLLRNSPADTIYLTWEWLYTWWEIYGDSARNLHVLVIKNKNGEMKGIAPFIIREKKITNLFTSKVLEFLGTGEDEIDEVCSNYMDIIVKDCSEEVYKAIFEHIVQGLKRGDWDEVNLKSVPISSYTLEVFKNKMNRAFSTKISEPISCAIITLPEKWDTYLEGIDRNWRSQIKRGRKEIVDKGNIQCELIKEPKEAMSAFDEFINIHQKRWQEAGKTWLFSSKKFTDFHKNIVKLFSNQKWIGIRFLKCNGATIAASYRINYNNTIYPYLSAYDREFENKIGIGLIERSYDIEDAINSGYKCYDFYKAKNGSYKWHLAKDKREVQDIIIYRKNVKYYLIIGMKYLKSGLRRIVKSCLGNRKV